MRRVLENGQRVRLVLDLAKSELVSRDGQRVTLVLEMVRE